MRISLKICTNIEKKLEARKADKYKNKYFFNLQGNMLDPKQHELYEEHTT